MPSKESIEAENAALKIRIVELTGDERAHSLTRDGEIQEEPEHIDEEVVGTKDGTTLLVQEEPTTQNGSTTDRRVIEPDVPDQSGKVFYNEAYVSQEEGTSTGGKQFMFVYFGGVDFFSFGGKLRNQLESLLDDYIMDQLDLRHTSQHMKFVPSRIRKNIGYKCKIPLVPAEAFYMLYQLTFALKIVNKKGDYSELNDIKVKAKLALVGSDRDTLSKLSSLDRLEELHKFQVISIAEFKVRYFRLLHLWENGIVK
jgi:hypothetical protein